MLFVWVALGGALGAVARYGFSQAMSRLLGTGFPYGILTINVLGSLAMGAAMAFFLRKMPGDSALQLFLTTGVLGGFTTFSAFSYDVLRLVNSGQSTSALVYGLASVGLSVLAVFVGFALLKGMLA
jgi:fluoride exporter